MKLYTPSPEPRNTARLTQVIARIFVLRQHEDRVQQLCYGKPQAADRDAQAHAEARRLTTKAGASDIQTAIATIEHAYGKYYSDIVHKKGLSINPADEIAEMLSTAKVTIAELAEWVTAVKNTSYPLGTGTNVQPLPNRPEAYSTLSIILAALKPDRATASMHLAVKPVPLSRDEIIEAISLDYWDDLPHAAKIDAWRMIPAGDQQAIKLRCGQDKESIKAATRDWHLDEIRSKSSAKR